MVKEINRTGRGVGSVNVASGQFQIGGRSLAALHLHLVADLLSFIKATQASSLNRGDVDEDILAAILRHDETEAFCGIEPLDSPDSHSCVKLRAGTARGAQQG